MANKKIAGAIAAAISLTIISASCGKVENLRVDPAVTADVKTSTDTKITTQAEVTTTAKTSAGISAQTDVSQSVTDPATATQENISDESDTNNMAVTKSQVEVQGPGPVQTQKPQDNNTPQPQEDEPTYINGILIANKTYKLPRSYAPGGLTSATEEAFEQLKSAAADQGLSLKNSSGYRSYDDQERIYNQYVSWDGQANADTYSARPGHSEHQTGLALDLNSIDASFENTPEFEWVSKNCYKYGFIIRYPKGKESITGYKYEPWHLRYLGVETATAVYNSGLCLEEYLGITSAYAD